MNADISPEAVERLAPWLAPVLAGALFALWVAAHLVRWVVL